MRSFKPLSAPAQGLRSSARAGTIAGVKTIGGGRIIVAAIVVGLAGCAVGPEYNRPDMTLEAFHSVGGVTPQSPPAPSMDAWWSGFNDPELNRIIERALAQNLDLAASLARVQLARARAQEAGVQDLPTFAANAGATTMRQSVRSPLGLIASHAPGYFRDGTDYDVGLGATWELDLFGGLRRGAQAASAAAEAAQADRLGVRVIVASDAADA
jgi:outer membrane protein TolC